MRLPRPAAVPAALLGLLFASGACRGPATSGVRAAAAPIARPTTVATPVLAPGTAGPVTASAADSARRPVVDSVRSEELARAVVAVFGDTVLQRDTSDAEAVDAPVWDLDVRSYEAHERVAHYVTLFSRDARDRFVARLSRGTRYEPMIRAKLRAGGLPEDMTYLALIESGYDPNAYSRAAAVGMWQFMTSTARDVGMRVDWWVDERRDPARATDGAIRFLRDLQEQFGGSLYLAAAAYNGGPGRVSRGLTRFADEMGGTAGEDRFFALAEQDYLRAETKNYVPQLIAAALVAKLPAKYGLKVDTVAAYAYDSVQAAGGTSLAAVAAASGTAIAELRELNPAILRGITPPEGSYWVKVPAGSADRTASALLALPESSRRGYTTRTVSGTRATLASLAADAGVSTKALSWFNPGVRTTKRGRLVAGQTVRIPAGDALAFARELPDPSIERYGTATTRTLASSGFHVVRRGESLGTVAKRYGLSTARLKALNRIRGTRLIAGQTLRVKGTLKSASKSVSKSASKSTTAKRASTGKASAKSSSARKASAKSSSLKKATVRKSSAKKATVRKAAPKKKPSTARKAPSTASKQKRSAKRD